MGMYTELNCTIKFKKNSNLSAFIKACKEYNSLTYSSDSVDYDKVLYNNAKGFLKEFLTDPRADNIICRTKVTEFTNTVIITIRNMEVKNYDGVIDKLMSVINQMKPLRGYLDKHYEEYYSGDIYKIENGELKLIKPYVEEKENTNDMYGVYIPIN